VVVSAVLGHASPAFAIAVYQHAWQEGPAEAAQALETALHPSPALAIRWQGGVWVTRYPETNPKVPAQKGGAGWTRTSDRRIMSPLPEMGRYLRKRPKTLVSIGFTIAKTSDGFL
jgi:hypothetical protein